MNKEDYYDETQLDYIEPSEYELEDDDTVSCVVSGKDVVYYKLLKDKIVYTDKNGVEIQDVKINELKLINKKGITMTTDYKKQIEIYGLDENVLKTFRARGCAYKPHSYMDNKLYVGSYLMLDNNENPFTVLETTYKGEIQKNYNFNQRTIGFYDLGELENIADVRLLDSFTINTKSKVDIDNIFEEEETNQLVAAEIEVYRVQMKSVDMVVYYNTTTRTNTGSKLYAIYEAEKALRNKPKNLDDLFEDSLSEEVKSMSVNDNDKHINEI